MNGCITHNALHRNEKVGVNGCIIHYALYRDEKVGVRGGIIDNALYRDEKVGVSGCIMHNALYCNEKVGVRGCIMHNGGIPDRVIADTIDILPLLTALSGNTIRSNLLKCKKAKKKNNATYHTVWVY